MDGIVFHQLLQVHNMLSARYPKTGVDPAIALANVEINMFWDGMFHAFTWIMTVVGLVLLWNVAQRQRAPLSTRVFVGSLLMGWGTFNLVEGIIDHHLIGIHHVIEGPNHLPWDLAFLGSGIVFLIVGWAIAQPRRGEAGLEMPGRAVAR